MKFAYTAKNSLGQSVRGVAEATNTSSVVAMLRDQKLVPINIKEKKERSAFAGGLSRLTGSVSVGEMANFTRQLSTMITSGLPLTDALNLLKMQSSPTLSTIVSQILADVQSGQGLSTAMAKHPKAFNSVYVALVKAGESAGIMDKILNRLADTSEKSREFRAKVLGAMIYPIIILIGMAGVMAVMVLVVIPKLSALYADFGAELPGATKAVVWVSDFSLKYWWLIIIGIVGSVFAFKTYAQTATGRRQLDILLYKVPIVGSLMQQVMLTELTRTLSLLLSAGVSVVDGLNIVSDAINNSVAKSDVKQIAKQVEKGFPISISFSQATIFPPLVGQMMAVGEETGKLDEVLGKLSGFFEMEAGEKIKALTTAIEPIILIVLALGVGFLMYAIITPIYTIIDKV